MSWKDGGSDWSFIIRSLSNVTESLDREAFWFNSFNECKNFPLNTNKNPPLWFLVLPILFSSCRAHLLNSTRMIRRTLTCLFPNSFEWFLLRQIKIFSQWFEQRRQSSTAAMLSSPALSISITFGVGRHEGIDWFCGSPVQASEKAF